MKEYKVKGGVFTTEQTVTLKAANALEALSEAKSYFPEQLHNQLTVSGEWEKAEFDGEDIITKQTKVYKIAIQRKSNRRGLYSLHRRWRNLCFSSGYQL
ncbi:hypothetical protein [Brevibacillus laterosporus]|uniref:hypothetical protein n=1 Tax=Brevibacillus laterosporus TaxID=1465 RepID=UPI003D1E28D5